MAATWETNRMNGIHLMSFQIFPASTYKERHYGKSITIRNDWFPTMEIATLNYLNRMGEEISALDNIIRKTVLVLYPLRGNGEICKIAPGINIALVVFANHTAICKGWGYEKNTWLLTHYFFMKNLTNTKLIGTQIANTGIGASCLGIPKYIKMFKAPTCIR